mmetsp:Transcript_3017/g.3446  ORF Transcript_3017/g.3446 Transcript_3017/m.3446 type:complete len:90 (+) Transcript_3017:363-632(+)
MIPPGYVGRVVLHDDRSEARLTAQKGESEHRFLKVQDGWQLLGLHPFGFKARGEGEGDDLEQVGGFWPRSQQGLVCRSQKTWQGSGRGP